MIEKYSRRSQATARAGSAARKSRFTLRQRLLLLTAVALLPAFLIIVASQLSSRATRTQEVDDSIARITDEVRGEVVRGMTGAATMMIAMGHSALTDPANATACKGYSAAVQKDFPTIVDIAVADPSGKVYCSSGPSDAAALQADMDSLIAGIAPNGLSLGEFTSTAAGPALPMGSALTTADKTLKGYILFNVDLDVLVQLVNAATQGIVMRTVVTDRNGTVLLSLPANTLEAGKPLPDQLAPYLHAASSGITRVTETDGQTWLLSYRPTSDQLPIAVFFERPEARLMAPLDRDALISTTIAVAGAGLAFLAAWFIGSVFIRQPVVALDRVLDARRGGDNAARSGLEADGSEFGHIGTAIDRLFDELDRREALQRAAEEQRDLQAREVQHRVKNLMAVIQVIARQTLSREHASPEVRTFEGRIDAMIRANTSLLAQDARAGDLGTLLGEAIAPFVDLSAGRVSMSGPPVPLTPKVAMALSLAAHEMATNAAKYGALSVPGGRIDVSWAVDGQNLVLDWRESGGPAVAPPSVTGFGSLLISRALEVETRGKVATEFAPAGFTFRLTALVDAVSADAGSTESPSAETAGPAS